MNVSELRLALQAAGVRENSYDVDLDGFSLPSERYCLRREGPARWVTYYSERGQRSGERAWVTESEACEHLLEDLLRDPTTRAR